jgi:hypothetical protein
MRCRPDRPKSPRPPPRRSNAQWRLVRAASLVVLLAAFGVSLAACAGGSPGAAKTNTTVHTVTGLTLANATSGDLTGTGAANSIRAATEAACKAAALTVITAITSYKQETGSYPAALSTLTTTKTATGVTVGPWLRSEPTGGSHYAFPYDPSPGKIGVKTPPSARAIPYTADPTSACGPP